MEVQIESTGALGKLGDVVGCDCYWGIHGRGGDQGEGDLGQLARVD